VASLIAKLVPDIEVAVAAPIFGVVKVGLVALTIFPEPVDVVHCGTVQEDVSTVPLDPIESLPSVFVADEYIKSPRV
jgi:hypothetical protein